MTKVSNLVRNLKSALLCGQIFMIPQKTVEKEDLSYNEISTESIKRFVVFSRGDVTENGSKYHKTPLLPIVLTK